MGLFTLNTVVFKFLHHHLTEKLPIRAASTHVIQSVLSLWDKAKIPTRPVQHATIVQLGKLFEDWGILKKHNNRVTPGHKLKEADFIDRLEDLFDVAHALVLDMMNEPEDKKLSVAQREKGRRGVMGSVGQVTVDKLKRARETATKEEKQRQKNQ